VVVVEQVQQPRDVRGERVASFRCRILRQRPKTGVPGLLDEEIKGVMQGE